MRKRLTADAFESRGDLANALVRALLEAQGAGTGEEVSPDIAQLEAEARQLLAQTQRPLPRPTLTRVDDFLWRGKAPDDAEVAGLAQMGFRSTVTFRKASTGDIRDEERQAREAGINFLSIPVNNHGIPSLSQAKTFLDFVTNPDNQPCYNHCAKGVGRTGCFDAAYRMAIPDRNKLDANGNPRCWTAAEAIAEAKSNGMSSSKQINWIRNFERQLKSGQVPGYPLSEPMKPGPMIELVKGVDINDRAHPIPVLTARMTPEKAAAALEGLYANILGRAPDAEHAQKVYQPLIEQGHLAYVAGELLASAEFRGRSPPPTAEQLVAGLDRETQRMVMVALIRQGVPRGETIGNAELSQDLVRTLRSLPRQA